MANVLSVDDQILVLHHLVEGTSIRSVSRVTGIHQTTILKLLVRFGHACRDFLDGQMRGLELHHLEIDEQWTFVAKKQGRVRVDESDARIGDQYLWLAIDMETKLVPTFAIGKRSADNARRFCVDLANRIALPVPTDTGERPGIIPQISTDGFNAYPEAIDLAFGSYCRYGQLIKDYRNTDMPGRYAAPELIGTDRREIFGRVPLATICTSHAERVNLTTRTLLKRFTRLSLCFSKKLENLCAAVATEPHRAPPQEFVAANPGRDRSSIACQGRCLVWNEPGTVYRVADGRSFDLATSALSIYPENDADVSRSGDYLLMSHGIWRLSGAAPEKLWQCPEKPRAVHVMHNSRTYVGNAWFEDEEHVAIAMDGSVQIWHWKKNVKRTTLYLMPENKWAFVNHDTHCWNGSPGADRYLRYEYFDQVRNKTIRVDPAAYGAETGWKNDPKKAGLGIR